MDKETVGLFIAEQRKKCGLTQKELAEKLMVSDKAVSKWERGLSFPDITLLEPLSRILSVSVTGLIGGKESNMEEKYEKEEVDRMIRDALEINREENKENAKMRLFEKITAVSGFILLGIAGCITIAFLNINIELLTDLILEIEILFMSFAVYAWVRAKEVLPTRYDKEKVTVYTDGAFSMNFPGVRFNNSNWKHILHAMRLWSAIGVILFPWFMFLCDRVLKLSGFGFLLYMIPCFIAIFSIFIPLYVTAKKYE